MVKRNVTLSIDKEVYIKFKKKCKEGGFIASKHVENWMKKEVEEE